MKSRKKQIKTYQVTFRNVYEVRHSIEIKAKNQVQAIKFAEKEAKNISHEDEWTDAYLLEDPDDFNIYEVEPE